LVVLSRPIKSKMGQIGGSEDEEDPNRIVQKSNVKTNVSPFLRVKLGRGHNHKRADLGSFSSICSWCLDDL
jgi:hypothetical protein